MVKYIKTALLSIALLSGFAYAADECVEPASPAIPDREDMTESELIALVSEVKEFNTVNEAYRQCVGDRAEELSAVATPEQQELWVIQYNNSVDLEHTLAENLNSKIRAYKEKHK